MQSNSYRSLKFMLIAVLSLSACKEKYEDPRLDPPLVRSMSVPEAKAPVLTFTGLIAARVQTNLGFRVSGKVVERLVDVGEIVKKNQPLMRIDKNDLSLAITAKEEAVKAAKAHAKQTISYEKRYSNLLKYRAVSKEEYELAKATADSARAQLSADEAELQIAKNEGSYSLLIADSDGTVVETLAEPGQVVNAGQTVINLAHDGPREASIDLPETIRPSPGLQAEARLYGGDNYTAAHLRQLSDSADPQTRTFEARYVLEGDLAKAPLGATVTVYIPVEGTGNRIEVPLGAIFNKGNGSGVWLIEGDEPSVRFHSVEIISLTEETALLKTDLKSTDKIVALGALLLHEGEAIRLDDTEVSP